MHGLDIKCVTHVATFYYMHNSWRLQSHRFYIVYIIAKKLNLLIIVGWYQFNLERR